MRMAKAWLTLAVVLMLLTACSKKQEVAPLPVVGEQAKGGAMLAYEHRLSIELPQGDIATRMSAVREACEAARFGACNVLRFEQDEHGGTLALRTVPAGVEPLTHMASEHGKLASRQTSAEDLAPAVQDNQRKLQQLEAYAAQLDQLAQRKDLSASDIIALAHERAQLQVDREALQATAAQQQQRLDTNLVTLTFVDTSHAYRLGLSFSEWVDRGIEGIGDALSMLAYGLPFLLLAFPLALLWRWLWRRVTRSARAKAAA